MSSNLTLRPRVRARRRRGSGADWQYAALRPADRASGYAATPALVPPESLIDSALPLKGDMQCRPTGPAPARASAARRRWGLSVGELDPVHPANNEKQSRGPGGWPSGSPWPVHRRGQHGQRPGELQSPRLEEGTGNPPGTQDPHHGRGLFLVLTRTAMSPASGSGLPARQPHRGQGSGQDGTNLIW